MKLVCLNIWGGINFEPLISFLKERSDTDVFCFQEVFDNGHSDRPFGKEARMDIFDQLTKALSNHQGLFSPEQENEEGIAIFVKKDIKILNNGSLFVHQLKDGEDPGNGTTGRILQWIRVSANGKEYTISHFHGVWQKEGKGDTPERIEQSRKVRAFLDSISTPQIICGDFNLLSSTQSFSIISEGLKDLIQENSIKTTRSQSFTGDQACVDHMLVSPYINIQSFQVLKEDVSDHLPLFLDFS